jgi:hypothetical protein
MFPGLSLRRLLEDRPAPVHTEATLPDALQTLYETKFTGRVYVDFAQGQPKAVQIPACATVKLI